MADPVLSILMPVFNERQRVLQAIRELEAAALPWSWELIVVDDGSTDGTRDLLQAEIASRPTTKLLFQSRNKGKGAAIRRALPECRGTWCVIQDADLEYHPTDLPTLMEPLMKQHADIVYGSRFWGLRSRRVLLFWHAMGNHLVTLFANMMADLNLTDVESGYKAFRTDVLQSLPLKANRFEFEIEVTIKAARRGHIFYEVPISYHGRTYAEGKKITWRDGVIALAATLWYRICPMPPKPLSQLSSKPHTP